MCVFSHDQKESLDRSIKCVLQRISNVPLINYITVILRLRQLSIVCTPAWCLYVNDDDNIKKTLCINSHVYTYCSISSGSDVECLFAKCNAYRARQRILHTPARAHAKIRSVCTRLKAASACLRHCQKVVNRIADSFSNHSSKNKPNAYTEPETACKLQTRSCFEFPHTWYNLGNAFFACSGPLTQQNTFQE